MGLDLHTIFNIVRRIESKIPSTSTPKATTSAPDAVDKETLPTAERDSSMEALGSPADHHNPSAVNDETMDTPTAAVPKRSTLQTFLLMAALCMSVFLAALDVTIVTTALPTISEHFHSTTGYTWVGSAFLLATAASTPTWGKLSDIFGRKVMLLGAVTVFMLGSTLCGAAISITMLIVGRAFQGLGAGGLLTLVNIVISDIFSQRDRATYYGIIGMVWATAGATGPVLGGVLTDKVTWRWCFYINLPISGLAFAIIFCTLNVHIPKTPLLAGLKAIDWIGTVTVTGSTLMFLLGLQFGGVTHPWTSAIVLCLIIFGIITVCLFSVVEWKIARYPMMPIHLFQSASNIAALLVVFLHGLVFIAGAFYLPLYFQAVLGATPLLSGVYILPYALSLSLSSAATGIYIKKTGRYIDCIRFGFVVTSLGFGLFYILPGHRDWAKIILLQIVAGIGVGPNFQSPLLALQSNVSAQDNATVTALFGFVRNVATAIGVVVGAVVFNNKMEKQQDRLRATLGDSLASSLSGGSAGANVFLLDGLPEPQKSVARDVFYNSVREIWIVTVAFAGTGLIVCLFIKKNKLNKKHKEVKTGLEAEEERRTRVMEGRKRKPNGNGTGTGTGVTDGETEKVDV